MSARFINHTGWDIIIAASPYFLFDNALHYCF
jgi:hypothetical protein